MRITALAVTAIVLNSPPVAGQSLPGEASSSTVDTRTVPSATPPKTIDLSSFVGSPHPDQFVDSKIEGYDYLNGALAVEDKAAKVSFAPFLALPTYSSVYSELRFQVAQKDGIPSVGLGWKWNPHSPRSKTGQALWVRKANETITTVYPVVAITSLAAKEQELKTLNEAIKAAGTGSREAIELDVRRRALSDQVAEDRIALDKTRAAYDKEFANLVLDYYDALIAVPKPILGLSYSVSLFGALSGTAIDKDGDGLQDNAYRVSKREAAVTVDWTPCKTLQLAGLYRYAWERPQQKEGTTLSESQGWGVTVGRVFSLLTPDRYKDTEDFQKSFFRPAIVAGLAVEFSSCTSAQASCKDMVRNTRAMTPFVDFKIKKESQFRLGLPFRKVTTLPGETQTEIGIVTVVAIQLGLPR